MTIASPPAFLMPAATASQASALRLEMTTLAPSEAMISAAARPMPLLEPVMTATWPERSKGFFMALRCLPALYVNLLPRPRSAPRVRAIIVPELERQQQGTAMGEERPWEKSYPPGVRWDAPIEMATLPALFDRLHRQVGGQAGARISRPQDDLCRAARRRRGGRLRPDGPGRRAGHGRRPLPAEHALPPHLVLRRAQGRRAHRAPLPARCRAGAGLQARRTPARASWSPPTSASWRCWRRSCKARRPGRSSDRRRRHGLRPLGHPDHADRRMRRASCASTSCARTAPRSCRGNGPRSSVEDVALLQYTGGTTGKPKGAMLSHANLSAACSIYKIWGDPQRISEPGTDKIICVLPLFHIFALTLGAAARPAAKATSCCCACASTWQTTLNDIEVKKATAFPGVPTMWIALANTPGIDKRDFSSLRYAGSGGAALPVEVAERFQKLTGQRLGGGWGMTETSPAGTGLPREWTGKAGSVGLPLPGIMMDIVALDDPRRAPGARREGRDPHQGPERHQGLLERAGGNGGRLRRRLSADRRHRLHGRGRLFLSRRPQEGHDHLRRVQRLSAHHRGGDLRASRASPR